MTRRAAGMTFIGIAALLFCTRYLAAAIYGAGISVNNEYSQEAFERFLSHVGDLPVMLSVLSLIFGFAYLLWAEKDRG